MRILFETNVVLDLLLDRDPFSMSAAQLFVMVESRQITGYLCATTVTTIHYLAQKTVGRKKAQQQIQELMSLFSIADVNRPVLELAVTSKFKDFEDSVLHQSALQVQAQGIVTRNSNDFKHSVIPVYSPAELLQILHLKQAQETDTDNLV